MFATYLRRELSRRRRQTTIVAAGMALAIALVIVVNALAAGVKDAQAASLEQLYGVGTDITISATPTAPGDGGGPGRRFDFGAADGSTTDGTTAVSQSRLELARGSAALSSDTVETAASTAGVSGAVGVLKLENTTFDGQLPDAAQMQQQAPADGGAGSGDTNGTAGGRPMGGPDGAGGSSFDVNSFSVLGIDPAAATLGPLTATTLTGGRTLADTDAAADVAVLDSAYATEAGLAVGGTIDLGGTTFEIVGLVTSTASDGTSASDVYIPLQVAQALSGQEGMVSSVYVQAASADSVSAVKSDLQAALPDTTVNTQSDLASSVSGSVSSAAGLITGLGTWLSILALVAAFAVAILFTISGVTRRTREFGTLKALGWSDRRVVGQVAGESLLQGAIGGAAGVVLGLVGILIVNLIAPTIGGTSAVAATAAGQGGGPGGGMPGGFGGAVTEAVSTITLHLPITFGIIGLAIAISLLGGLLAGALGGWRASRLRPAAAFRSVD